MLLKRSILHAVIAVAVLGALFLAPRAEAGTYSVPFCTWSQSGTSTSGWEITTTVGATQYFWGDDVCRTAKVYRRFEYWAVAAGASNDMTFNAPPGTYISQFQIAHDAYPRSAGAVASINAWQEDGSMSLLAAAYAGGALGSGTYNFPLSGSKVIKLRESIGCQSSSPCPGQDPTGRPGNEDFWYGGAVKLVDPSLPVFDALGGAGWSAEPVDGQDTIDWAVSDTGAGVKQVDFFIDGVQQTSVAAPCVTDRLVPCRPTVSGTFTLDTTRFSEGTHALELHATDGALNETVKRLSITVRRPPQAADSGAGSPISVSNTTTAGNDVPAVGDHLHGSQGSWVGTGLTFTYQWLRCDADGNDCVPIPGATAVDYTPTSSDVGHALMFCVTATNSSGSASNCSMPTAPVIAAHPSSGGGATPVSADPVERPGEPLRTPASTNQQASTAVDRGQPNGSPAADRVVLTALANSRVSTLRVKYGKRVPIGGRLLNPSGTPIAGAVLEIQTRMAMPNAPVLNGGRVVTGSDGRFKYTAPVGPSRTVRFAYRSHSADLSFADVSDVNLLVSAGVTIKATPKRVRNRHATIFTGRLLGKPIAKRGVVVDLQVFFRNKWRTFGAPRTNRAGKYRFKYRFMAGAATWKFRARVRRETSYPYSEGYSRKTVKVKVTG